MIKSLLMVILFLVAFTSNAQNSVELNSTTFEYASNQDITPPPPSFGADGPGSPVPPSNIDAYTIYLIAIGGLMIFLFRKKIFEMKNIPANIKIQENTDFRK